jgi:hypothetical protein
MTAKKAFLFLLIVLSLASCGKTSNQTETKAADSSAVVQQTPADSLTEDIVMEMVFALPEVKERADYIEKETKGQRHMQALINQAPDATTNYYWVKAGEDNGTNFVTHFNFLVYPDRKIMYYDAINDTTITLDAWRLNKQKEKE